MSNFFYLFFQCTPGVRTHPNSFVSEGTKKERSISADWNDNEREIECASSSRLFLSLIARASVLTTVADDVPLRDACKLANNKSYRKWFSLLCASAVVGRPGDDDDDYEFVRKTNKQTDQRIRVDAWHIFSYCPRASVLSTAAVDDGKEGEWSNPNILTDIPAVNNHHQCGDFNDKWETHLRPLGIEIENKNVAENRAPNSFSFVVCVYFCFFFLYEISISASFIAHENV